MWMLNSFTYRFAFSFGTRELVFDICMLLSHFCLLCSFWFLFVAFGRWLKCWGTTNTGMVWASPVVCTKTNLVHPTWLAYTVPVSVSNVSMRPFFHCCLSLVLICCIWPMIIMLGHYRCLKLGCAILGWSEWASWYAQAPILCILLGSLTPSLYMCLVWGPSMMLSLVLVSCNGRWL